MKLVFTKKTLPHYRSFGVDWNPTEEVSWISLFLRPTSEETRKGFYEDPEVRLSLFDAFSRESIPADSRIYALLGFSGIKQEYQNAIQDLRASGLEFVTKEDVDAERGRLSRWLRLDSGLYVLVADVRWEHISRWYRKNAFWSIDPYTFLISPTPLEDWKADLRFLMRYRLDKQFLRRVGRLLTNSHEDGMEVIGFNIDPTPLERVATELSKRFQLPIQVQEKGDPYGDP